MPPQEMTFSTLIEIEACPRRWALRRADYPEVWTGRGYPPRLHVHALAGTVLHLAIEELTTALVRARCETVHSETAVGVMKGLGGSSTILAASIDRVIRRFEGNPRCARDLALVAASLRKQIPDLRTKLQTILSRLTLPQTKPTTESHPENGPMRGSPSGFLSEVQLRAGNIGWKGTADLIAVTSNGCEITDFKTGEPDEDHALQLRVYALLWSRDRDRNPDGRLANRLIVAYDRATVEVSSPTNSELDLLEAALVIRQETAIASVSQHPPEARPSRDNCQYCSVRHLCEAYWDSGTQMRLGAAGTESRFADMEVAITARHGPSSWDGTITSSAVARSGDLVFLQGASLPFLPRPGQRVRILGGHVEKADADSLPTACTSTLTVALSAGSEVFLVPEEFH